MAPGPAASGERPEGGWALRLLHLHAPQQVTWSPSPGPTSEPPSRSSAVPARQMDAPLWESLEGSGVFCFNWRARADSYGAIFIREGLETGSVGTALQTQP